MSQMLQDLVVIAKHGEDYINDCVRSLDGFPLVVIDTGTHHPTGAYLKAFRTIKAKNYLFIQDSMKNLSDDPIKPFREKMPELGAVAWAWFAYYYDNAIQRDWVEAQYKENPTLGIFGPIFYTSYETLQKLEELNLLPLEPNDKLEAQGTERAWACAFHMADLPVEYLYDWNPNGMTSGDCPPFSKHFGGR